jgi:N-formylglutamate amidohydrolase
MALRIPALLWACFIAGSAFAAEPESLIVARAGDLPILLTAPHGGLKEVPGVPLRRSGIRGTDTNTMELAEAVSAHLERSLGARPYLVAAQFSRKYIDANRAIGEALESPAAQPAYMAYHDQIRAYLAHMKQRSSHGVVLIDVHGQSEEPLTAIRGTQNGKTVSALLRNHGIDALKGSNSIFGVIEQRGFKVFPPSSAFGISREDPRFNGGFTVMTYGSNNVGGVDAIQIETGRDIRTNPAYISALGDGIIAFYKAYLQANPASGGKTR